MNIQVYNELKKHYLKFTEKKFKKLLNPDLKSNEDTYKLFQSIWKNEHGGLFPLENPFGDFIPLEILPFVKDDIIYVTDTGSNSAAFKKQYVKTLNELILNTPGDILNLDFSNNYGGKPAVMIAGLLPIFNNYSIKVLLYYYDRDGKRHRDILHEENKIISVSNHYETVSGTNKSKKFQTINIYYNEFTTSSAEQSILCLLSISKLVNINLIGKKSMGATTVNYYVELNKDYGLEIPIGYMGTKHHIYKKGVQS